MNFLGHLYFSDNNHELMYANLFGDHTKGNDFEEFPPLIRSGIILHRSIDFYIDHHPEVVDLMHLLYPELPKVSGIAIDLFFDHLLAKNWKHFHPEDFETYLDKFYTYQPKYWEHYPFEFKFFIEKMREYRWMNYYPLFEGLSKSCEGVSKRISFPNRLKNAPEVFLKFEKEIEHCFVIYMREAIPFMQAKLKTLDLSFP